MPNETPESVLSALKRKYIVVGKTHVRHTHAWGIIGVCVGILLGIVYVADRSDAFLPSFADNGANVVLHGRAASNLEVLTLKVFDKGRKWNAASEEDIVAKDQTKAELITALTERKQAMLREIANDPEGVMKVALPKEVRDNLPDDVKALIEEEVTIKGKFEAFYIDNIDGSYQYESWVRDEVTGTRYRLHFAGNKIPNFLTDDRVQVRGVRVDNELALSGDSTSVQALAASPVVAPNTFGAQKTLVMLVNFTDKATEPYTAASALSVMNTTSNFDLENSFNQTSLIGVINNTVPADVAGWFTIPVSYTTCSTSNIASYAKQAAAAAGFNLSSYTRYVYGFPTNACSWWGLGSVGGNPSNAWVNGSFTLKVVGHEMGHNLGLFHSRSQSCASGACTTSEYGDVYDIMGNPTSDHFNAFQKSRLGWLNYKVSPPITAISTSGTYTIAPFELNDTQPKALQILKDSSTNTYYYVEYRAGLGFDAGVIAVIMHSGSVSSPNSSNLWDLDQITSTSDWILNVGQTYQDAAAGVSITAVSADATGATINVGITAAPCVRASPVVSVSPGSQSAVAGKTLSYTVTVTSKDSSTCAATGFSVSSSLAGGLTQSPSSWTLNLSPGQSQSQTTSVTSPVTTPEGFYSLTETAVNTSQSSYTGSASANYTVLLADVTPPAVTITAPQNNSILPAKGTATVSASATDASGIASIVLTLDSSVIKTCTKGTRCSTKVNVNSIAKGTHTVSATATDKSSNSNTSSASISVTK